MPQFYNRAPDDLMFRKVFLFGDGSVPEYERFTSEGQRIQYEDSGYILEVLKSDGHSELIYERPIRNVAYGCIFNDPKSFWVNSSESDFICARLWLCKEGYSTQYKLPARLVRKNNLLTICVPGGTQGAFLVGDKYFNMAYRLVRN